MAMCHDNVSCHRWLLREELLRFPYPHACTFVGNGCVLVDGWKEMNLLLNFDCVAHEVLLMN